MTLRLSVSLKRLLLAAFAALLLLAAGLFALRSGRAGQQAAAPAAAAPPAKVVATGLIDAGDRAEVSARVAGILDQVLVKEGDRVKAGDVLAVQSRTALRAALVQAQAEVARQEDNLLQLTRKAELTATQTGLQLEAAQTKLASARAALSDSQTAAAGKVADAEHGLVMLRQSLNSSATADLAADRSKNQTAGYDAAVRSRQAAAEQFQEQVAGAELKLAMAKAEVARLNDPAGQPALNILLVEQELEQVKVNAELLRILPEDEAAARAALTAAREAVLTAQENLNSAEVRAPINGVVLNQYLKAGEMAGTGAKLFSLATVDQVVVKAKVDESDIGRVIVGQAVRVTSTAMPEREWHGAVSRIAPQAVKDGTATVIITEVTVRNPDGALRPGMNGDTEFETEAGRP